MYFTGSTEPSRSDHPSPPATSTRPLGDGDVWPTGVVLSPTPRVAKRHHRCLSPRYALALGSTWDCPECGRVWRLAQPFASYSPYPTWYRAGWWRSRQHRRRISLGELE